MKLDLATVVLGWDKTLATADHLLTRAVEHAGNNSEAESQMLDWRLAPDMFPLGRQVQVVCNLTRQWAARAAEIEVPAQVDGETSVAELRDLIALARSLITSLERDRFAGRDDCEIKVNLGVIEPTMSIGQWVGSFATTNILFHLSMIYAILRSRGVALGKPDLFAGGL